MVHWQYKTLRMVVHSGFFSGQTIDHAALQDALNENGERGWELVSIVTSQTNGYTDVLVAVMKRPVATISSDQE